jgi:hypothetical protein
VTSLLLLILAAGLAGWAVASPHRQPRRSAPARPGAGPAAPASVRRDGHGQPARSSPAGLGSAPAAAVSWPAFLPAVASWPAFLPWRGAPDGPPAAAPYGDLPVEDPRPGGRPRAGVPTRLLGVVPLALGAAERRRQAMEAAVPEVLDILRATVAAGASPYRALQAACAVAPQPLAASLTGAARAASLGAGAGSALAEVGRRERLAELAVAGEALDLAETTGAPPAPVLAGVTAAAGDRLRARQARLAATAQARLSARVVAGMAPCFLLVLAATSPDDAAFLVREPLGWATLATALVFELLGTWWVRSILRGRP